MTPKPVVYAKAKSTPTALAYVAAGEWWHVHHEAIQRLIDHGWVEDNVPGTGPDTAPRPDTPTAPPATAAAAPTARTRHDPPVRRPAEIPVNPATDLKETTS